MQTPRIFYQTYKTKNLPPDLLKYRNRWLKVLDSYETPVLDDVDLRNLVKDNFPQYLNFYDNMTLPIERVDFARNVMMYLGGIYADLDTYPLKSIDLWVDKNQIILGREPLEHSRGIYGKEIVICNAFMISPPR